jgi:hypothetical protein
MNNTQNRIRDAAALLGSLSEAQQAHFLVRLSYELTIEARSTYVAGGTGVERPEELRLLNETMHRALGQSDKCLRGQNQRYSAEAMAGILLGHDSAFMIDAARKAFERASKSL